MAFGRWSDDFADECWTLSDAAFRLHVEGLCWSARKLLDCVIPASDLPRFTHHPEAIDEVLVVGWWVVLDVPADHYRIIHNAAYQPLRENVLHRQQVNAENIRKRWSRERRTPSPPTSESPNESKYDSKYDGVRSGQGQGLASRAQHPTQVGDDNAEVSGAS
jgi:hypothetical protein